MPVSLTVYDETASGTRTNTLTLEFLTETVTARELIRRRVYEEVMEHNMKAGDVFRGLVQPTDTERALNGFKLKKPRKIDWEQQYQRAIEAFQRNGFFILAGNHQVEDLDEEISLELDTEVSFIKLVPLVGG